MTASSRSGMGRRKTASLLLLPVLVAVIAARFYLDVPNPVYNPVALLVLNTVFIGLIPVAVAAISLASFRRGGAVSVLLLGAGMLFIGLGSVTSALVQLLPNSSNTTITIFNLCALLGMALQLAGPLATLFVWRLGPERRTVTAAAAYAAVVVVGALVVAAAVLGMTPTFFAPGTGSTEVRNLVLTGAIACTFLASLLFFGLYRRRHEDFFFWYAVGLALFGLGLVSVAFQATFTGTLNLAGRVEEYAGAVYILGALLVLRRRAAGSNISIEELLTSFFAEAEAGYRQLIETAGDAIIVFGPDSRVLLWNAAAERLFGYPREAAIGMSVSALLEGDGGPPLPGEFDTPPGAFHRELRALRRDGTIVPVELTASRRAVNGQWVTTCIIHDISERKRTEEELRQYAADLQRSNEDLERFAYVSSHDLQEPLRSVVSFSQLLERRYRGRLDADADEYINFIVEGGTRMQALIQDLLAYSRVNSTRQPMTRTDVAAVLASVERNLDVQLREAGAALTHDSLPVVMADPLQLEQVLMNLVSNAVKFRRRDVPLQIHVGARRLDGMVELSVSDNGIGIEKEYFDRIFVIFQRLHTKEAYPGTGIGLAIVKRIIDRHGGTIRVESTPGEGSTFFFTLPAA